MNTRLAFILVLLALNHFGYAQVSSTEIQGNLWVADNPETSEVEGKLEVGYGISVGGGILGGPNSLAIGLGATAFGDLSVAMGSMVDGRVERTRAYGQYSVAFGFGAIAGDSADPTKAYNLAFGSGSAALEDGSIAIGKFASSTGSGAYAFGFKAQASGSSSFALGYETQANGYLCYAFGPGCIAELNSTLALGHFS